MVSNSRPRYGLVVALTSFGGVLLWVGSLVTSEYLANVLVELGGASTLFAAFALLEPRLTQAVTDAARPSLTRLQASDILQGAFCPAPSTGSVDLAQMLGSRLLELGLTERPTPADDRLVFTDKLSRGIEWVIQWDPDSLRMEVRSGSDRLASRRVRLRRSNGSVDSLSLTRVEASYDSLLRSLAEHVQSEAEE